MFHYIQSQLSMPKEVSVQWYNYHGVHADRTCRYTDHCLMGSLFGRKSYSTSETEHFLSFVIVFHDPLVFVLTFSA